jgi:hypothetical protein
LIAIFLFGAAGGRKVLLSSNTVIVNNGWPHPLVCQIGFFFLSFIFLFFPTGMLVDALGAGLQFLAGAPRILQALANDGTIPFLKFFRGTGEPRF